MLKLNNISFADDIDFPHRHSFYQVLYINEGSGEHTIDFEEYRIKKHTLFFLAPGQVHEWKMAPTSKGMLINFSELFFSSFLAKNNYIADFNFFLGNGHSSYVDVSRNHALIKNLFVQMETEYEQCKDCSYDMIRVLLLQLFILVNRSVIGDAAIPSQRHNYFLVRSFQKLVEQYYTTKRLPRDYAELLFITPNYLNALCKKALGRSAGEIIRDRILLEAKRLLINSALFVNEIGWQLKFEDSSYFSRFFKKYAGVTPEEFRENAGNKKL